MKTLSVNRNSLYFIEVVILKTKCLNFIKLYHQGAGAVAKGRVWGPQTF